MQYIKIPGRIDDPPHLLLWSADEMAPIMLGVVVGIFLDNLLICMGIGMLFTNVYRRFRDSNPDGFILAWLYNSGLFPGRGRSMINSYITRLYP